MGRNDIDVPEYIETERLLLRVPTEEDGVVVNAAIRESYSELRKWLNWADHIPDVAETEANVIRNREQFINRERFQFSIFKRDTQAYIGTCSLKQIEWDILRAEIGYWLRTSASGYGYMAEAVQALTALADHVFHANRLEIRCDVRNDKSRGVASRAGFYLEAILRQNFRGPEGTLLDECLYTKIRMPDGTLGYPNS